MLVEPHLDPPRLNDAVTATATHCRWRLRPDRQIVALSFRWAGLLLVLFVGVYAATNWISAQRFHRLRLWFDWELAIPLLPSMVWVYLSLFLTFFLPMFVLDVVRIHALCRRLAFATVLSGICFLLFPAELGFTRLPAASGNEAVFRTLHALDLPHNLAPSLHVSWSLLLLGSLAQASPRWLKIAFSLWLAALISAVLLTHQHHVLDVIGGMLVAFAACIVVRCDGRWA